MSKTKLAKYRKQKGLSQAELAKKTGLSRQAISLYEIGKREPNLNTWQKLASALEISVPILNGTEPDFDDMRACVLDIIGIAYCEGSTFTIKATDESFSVLDSTNAYLKQKNVYAEDYINQPEKVKSIFLKEIPLFSDKSFFEKLKSKGGFNGVSPLTGRKEIIIPIYCNTINGLAFDLQRRNNPGGQLEKEWSALNFNFDKNISIALMSNDRVRASKLLTDFIAELESFKDKLK